MRLPGKFFIAASHRHSASLSEEVCPLHVYTLHPVAFVHFEPFPAALTWILTRMTHDGSEARQILFALLTLSSSDMSLQINISEKTFLMKCIQSFWEVFSH